MGLKQLLTSGGTDNVHEAEINGETLKFYPVRVAAMLRAQSVVSEIARAVTAFFDPNSDNYTKRQHMSEQDKETGAIITSSVEDPISPVHAKERLKRREGSVVNAVEALMCEENAQKLAVLVIDSLRTSEIGVDDLINGDLSTFIQLVKESVTASAPQLAPLLTKAVGRMGSHPALSVVAKQDEPDKEEAKQE